MPVKSTAKHNGAAIRSIRVSQGRSCAEVAASIGIHEQTLRNLELYDSTTPRKKRCGVELIHRIARELNVPVNALLMESISHCCEAVGGDAS
ncbi:helix-turn-helix domain-containing protein [Nocardiopsis gilva]|nr:helix-turn-helix transcriptional regulator [Nocardiopsis gilva]